MNTFVTRILNLVPGGRHASDPLTRHPASACRACSREDYGPCTCPKDCGWLSCTGAWRDQPPGEDPRVTATLAQIQARVAVEQDDPSRGEPYRPRVPLAADYRALPVFQNVVRAACQAGITGIGTRGVHPVTPVPVFGLDRFTDTGDDDEFEDEFDQVAARAEAGFVQARRVFHCADTADFPAVTL